MRKLVKDIFLDRDEDDNLVLIIPPSILKKMGLKEGMDVDVSVLDGNLLIEKVKKKK